jgi:hypothetical protein
VSVVLLVIAMFMYRGFRAQVAGGPGYRTDHLLMMNFDPSLVQYSDMQAQTFYQRVAERARTVPGVTSVMMTSGVPMSNDSMRTVAISPEGFQFPRGQENVGVMAAIVDEYYCDTLGIPLLQGRKIRREDDDTSPRVAIVNQHLAQHYWPNQDSLGKRFRLNVAEKSWVEIVGPEWPSTTSLPNRRRISSTLPYRQRAPGRMFLVARSAGDAAALAALLRSARSCGAWT